MLEEDFEWIECDECDGEGRCEYTVPVIDWVHGGELVGKIMECEKCEGSGEVKHWHEEEEDDLC